MARARDRYASRFSVSPDARSGGTGDLRIWQSRLTRAGLGGISEKLDAAARLDLSDGIRLFDCPDLLAAGHLANRERERRHGPRTYYNYNIRLEATNVCVASC